MNIRPEYANQTRGVFGTLLHIARTENPRTLFRGVGVVASGAGPAHALYFSCYETSKNFLSGNSRSSVWVQGNVYTLLIYCSWKQAYDCFVWIIILVDYLTGCSAVLATLFHDGFMNPVDGECCNVV